jgi:hypothetical protein
MPCNGGINYGAMTNNPEPQLKVESKSYDFIKMPQKNSNNVRSEYTNAGNVVPTTWDFRFLFSEIIVEPPDQITAELRANVVMTPAHAKTFLYLLGAQMQEYEKQNGEIKIQWPPSQPTTPPSQ